LKFPVSLNFIGFEQGFGVNVAHFLYGLEGHFFFSNIIPISCDIKLFFLLYIGLDNLITYFLNFNFVLSDKKNYFLFQEILLVNTFYKYFNAFAYRKILIKFE